MVICGNWLSCDTKIRGQLFSGNVYRKYDGNWDKIMSTLKYIYCSPPLADREGNKTVRGLVNCRNVWFKICNK